MTLWVRYTYIGFICHMNSEHWTVPDLEYFILHFSLNKMSEIWRTTSNLSRNTWGPRTIRWRTMLQKLFAVAKKYYISPNFHRVTPNTGTRFLVFGQTNVTIRLIKLTLFSNEELFRLFFFIFKLSRQQYSVSDVTFSKKKDVHLKLTSGD